MSTQPNQPKGPPRWHALVDYFIKGVFICTFYGVIAAVLLYGMDGCMQAVNPGQGVYHVLKGMDLHSWDAFYGYYFKGESLSFQLQNGVGVLFLILVPIKIITWGLMTASGVVTPQNKHRLSTANTILAALLWLLVFVYIGIMFFK